MEVEVKDDDKNKRWMLDCIHADFDDQRRREQWSLSQRVAGRRADGWVVLGDLKDLLLPDDKEVFSPLLLLECGSCTICFSL